MEIDLRVAILLFVVDGMSLTYLIGTICLWRPKKKQTNTEWTYTRRES